MILKMMSNEDLMDDDSRKGCRIVAHVVEVHYYENAPTQEKFLDVTYSIPNRSLCAESFVLQGNAYLMNDDGKTVQYFNR